MHSQSDPLSTEAVSPLLGRTPMADGFGRDSSYTRLDNPHLRRHPMRYSN